MCIDKAKSYSHTLILHTNPVQSKDLHTPQLLMYVLEVLLRLERGWRRLRLRPGHASDGTYDTHMHM